METEVLFNFTMHFMLILIRIAAIFTFSPVFGRRNVPAMFKIGFSVMLSLILYNLFPAPSNQVFNLYAYTISCLKEMFVGLLIGYVTVMVFSSFRLVMNSEPGSYVVVGLFCFAINE
jgi:flagellar biosynthetic protein FliR